MQVGGASHYLIARGLLLWHLRLVWRPICGLLYTVRRFFWKWAGCYLRVFTLPQDQIQMHLSKTITSLRKER